MKKFIFITVNEERMHWSGWAAVNPWVQIARVLFERAKFKKNDAYSEYAEYKKFANGLIACDRLNEKGTKEARSVIWFLNLASAYRDMANENQLHRFSYLSHTPKSYWLLGCTGPFGMIDVINDNKHTFRILQLHKYIKPIQRDSYNCGVI